MTIIKLKILSILKHNLGLLTAHRECLVTITAPGSGTSIRNRAVSHIPSCQPKAQNPLALFLLLPTLTPIPKPHPFLFVSTPLLRDQVAYRTKKNPPPTRFTKISLFTQNSVPLSSAHTNTLPSQALLHSKPYCTSSPTIVHSHLSYASLCVSRSLSSTEDFVVISGSTCTACNEA
jgi:hypothetical protein